MLGNNLYVIYSNIGGQMTKVAICTNDDDFEAYKEFRYDKDSHSVVKIPLNEDNLQSTMKRLGVTFKEFEDRIYNDTDTMIAQYDSIPISDGEEQDMICTMGSIYEGLFRDIKEFESLIKRYYKFEKEEKQFIDDTLKWIVELAVPVYKTTDSYPFNEDDDEISDIIDMDSYINYRAVFKVLGVLGEDVDVRNR